MYTKMINMSKPHLFFPPPPPPFSSPSASNSPSILPLHLTSSLYVCSYPHFIHQQYYLPLFTPLSKFLFNYFTLKKSPLASSSPRSISFYSPKYVYFVHMYPDRFLSWSPPSLAPQGRLNTAAFGTFLF